MRQIDGPPLIGPAPGSLGGDFSTGRMANPYDNALAESFVAALKRDTMCDVQMISAA